MKIRIKLFIVSAILFISFGSPNDQVREVIRQKIENSSIAPITCFGERIHCTKSLSQFYQNRIFEPAWKTTTAVQLLEALQSAGEEGLRPKDYHLELIQQFIKNNPKTPMEKAGFDLLMTDAFLLYVSHLLSGKVNPEIIDVEWHVSRKEGDPVSVIEIAIASGNIKKTVQSILPKHEIYKSLKKALISYQSINKEKWYSISEGVTIKHGMVDKRIPEIRERLYNLGDQKEKSSGNPDLYDSELLMAVRSFQFRHGLESDGEIGSKTIGAMNIPVEQRILQVEANMERWRWLPRELGDYYLKVNIANFELEVVKNGKLVQKHKIVVGKPYRRTPVFSSQIQYLVLNPTWTVPPGILKADVLPGVRKDPSYLEKKRLSVLDHRGNPVNTVGIDWNSNIVRSYIYRQAPGPDNALGSVKFMFPNKFHVYLHDSPSKELFNKSERAFSSGCIRVQNPLELAEYLLNDPVNWNREKIGKVVMTNKTQTISLKEKPNVHLLYWTAWADSYGSVHFRKDIYERDKPLIEKLKEKPPV